MHTSFCFRICTIWITGMVRIAVNAEQDVVMLRSSTLDCYLTGHTDRSVVDGKV